jgi:WD40 repeat protein/serine/threonine protein kinase
VPNCPFCLAELSENDIQWGTCHRCNRALPEAEIDRIRCTFQEPAAPNSGSRPPQEMPAVEQPEAGPRPSEPPDRAAADESPQEEVKRETADENRVAATVADSDSLPDIDERVSVLWEGRFAADATPANSIKADSPSVRLPDLDVQLRNVCDPKAPQADRADYVLLGKLGKGGMGVVFAARQATIDRTVALKMLPPETAADAVAVRKFLGEAVVTGELEHPNIVPIYDAGADQNGALFYSMKQVQGTRWDLVIGEKTLAENLEILMKVADAVGYAHSKDVLHRDLKPENVMLAAFGEVLVMDWGLAVTTQATQKVKGVAGSPAYMPPEMATGRSERLGTTSDIYLLGAILHEIVTGRPPHHGNTVMECLQAAARNQMVATQKSGELLDVAMRAMADRPEDRYGSVAEFQQAIRSYLSHSESVILSTRAQGDLEDAQETDNYETFARALFRFQEAHALWRDNDRAREGITETSLAHAECALRKGDYDLGASVLVPGEPQHADLLRQIETAQRERNARQRRLKAARRLVGLLTVAVLLVVTWASLFSWDKMREAQGAREDAIAAQKDAEKKARDMEIARRTEAAATKAAQESERVAQEAERMARKAEENAKNLKNEAEYDAYVSRIGLAAIKIDENAFDRARTLLDECPDEFRDWEWGRLMCLCSLGNSHDAEQPIEAVAVTGDGRRFAVGGWGGTVRVWDADANAPSGPQIIDTGSQYVFALSFSPDGTKLAVGTNDQPDYLKVFDSRTGEPVSPLGRHQDAVVSIAYSKDGTRILTGSYDRTAMLGNPVTGEVLKELKHESIVWSAVFSSDEKRIITATQDGTVGIWSAVTGMRETVFLEHLEPVYAVAQSPRGGLVASGGGDQRILLWNSNNVRTVEFGLLADNGEVPPTDYDVLEGHTAAVRSLQFSDDGKRLVSSGDDNTVRVWDVERRTLVKTLRGHGGRVPACTFVLGSDRVFSGGHDRLAMLWNIPEYEEVRIRGGHDDDVLDAAFSPKGTEIVTTSRDRTAIVWDTDSGKELAHLKEGHSFLISTCRFFPGGKRLLTAAVDNSARIWDVRTGGERFLLDGTGFSAAAAISGDGEWVLTGSALESASTPESTASWCAKLWNSATGKLHRRLEGHTFEVTAVAASLDGSLLFTGDAKGYCRLWDRKTGAEKWKIKGHSRRVTAACFVEKADDPPNTGRILTASADNTVIMRNLTDGKEDTLVLKHRDAVTSMSLGRNGELLLTTSIGSTPLPERESVSADTRSSRGGSTVARLWDLESGKEIAPILAHNGNVGAAALTSQGQRIALALIDGPIEIWNVQQLRDGIATKPERVLSSGGEEIWSVAFHPDGKCLAAAGNDKTRILKVANGEVATRFARHLAVAVAAISPDGKWVVTGGSDGSAKIWNRQAAHVEHRLHVRDSGTVNDAVFSPDAKTVLIATDDGVARLWDAENGTQLKEFIGHKARVRTAAFSNDGSRIVTASDDMTARIWDAKTSETEHVLEDHDQAVLCAAFSRDGKWVITGGDDNLALIWDAITGKPRHTGLVSCELYQATCQGHTAGVVAVAFSPNGQRVITGSKDKTARIWDPQTGREILALKGHSQEVTSASFSPDGRSALTSSRDGTTAVWPTVGWTLGHRPHE